ncbi:Ger(x)C family spore germination protein [Neobacillus sp. GCM10023253]|uniref:Ger(x)C family spore germination protein n=1 Tax=Neobacillus sp. GCM10023253 TaxID=3252644 RepID=UPI003620EF64
MLKGPKWKTAILMIASTLCLSGCVEARQLEKLGLITAVGYDLDGKNKIKGTVVVHKFDALAKNVTKVISVEAHTSKTLRQKQNLRSDQRLVSGQLRCVVYSKELAEKGIVQLVDTLNRDPTIGNMVFLTIAEDEASSIINVGKNNEKQNFGTYLYNLINQNVQSEQMLEPTLQEFNHSYQDNGKDPVLPLLKVESGDVAVTGTALFKDDMLVTILPTNKLFFLKILADKYKSGTKELGFNRADFKSIIKEEEGRNFRTVYNKLFLNIDNIRSHTKIKLVDKKNLRFRIEIKFASRLLESTEPLELTSAKNIKFIEGQIEKKMEKEIYDLLVFFQKQGVDPVGIGNEYITHIRGNEVTSKDWRSIYKNAKFEVHVKTTIVKTGVID